VCLPCVGLRALVPTTARRAPGCARLAALTGRPAACASARSGEEPPMARMVAEVMTRDPICALARDS
jgi:hypothetical protein